MMKEWVVLFSKTDEALDSHIGGKARNLVKMVAEGFNVPDGFIVIAEM
jgi:phosphoenolpyruvate synthase/pyruvate phosphate dikinase